MASQRGRALQFSGHQHFRQRLVLSLLSRKPVRIDEIRSHDEDPGLKGKYTGLLLGHWLETKRKADAYLCASKRL